MPPATVHIHHKFIVIDAETAYEGRYGAAQAYIQQLRAAIPPGFPLGLTSFPYVDYHPALPYSVFLGPGGADFNVPQVYWQAIGTTVDNAVQHTYVHNRIYQRRRDRLVAALTKLPPRQREVLVLRYYDDLSVTEIAEATGLSTGTVKSTTSRGLDALQRIMRTH